MLLFVSSRGSHVACLERILNLDGSYRWERVGPGDSAGSAEIADYIPAFDADMTRVLHDLGQCLYLLQFVLTWALNQTIDSKRPVREVYLGIQNVVVVVGKST